MRGGGSIQNTIRGHPMTRTFESSCKIAKSAGFPGRHVTAIMGGAWHPTEEQGPAWVAINTAITSNSTAMLIGPNSGGKTYLLTLAGCVWTFGIQHETKGRARYWTLNDLLDDQKRTFDGRSDESIDPLKLARDCGLLVLDEIGEARASSVYAREQFVQLIDARYREEKPTLLASNMTEQAFLDQYGASTYERLKEGGSVTICDWKNYREILAGKDTK